MVKSSLLPRAGQFYIIIFFCLEDGTAGDKGVSAALAALSFSSPGSVPENLSLEDLRKSPLGWQFAGISRNLNIHAISEL